MIEIIYFWALFFPFVFPMGYLMCCKKEKLSEWLVEDEESDED